MEISNNINPQDIFGPVFSYDNPGENLRLGAGLERLLYVAAYHEESRLGHTVYELYEQIAESTGSMNLELQNRLLGIYLAHFCPVETVYVNPNAVQAPIKDQGIYVGKGGKRYTWSYGSLSGLWEVEYDQSLFAAKLEEEKDNEGKSNIYLEIEGKKKGWPAGTYAGLKKSLEPQTKIIRGKSLVITPVEQAWLYVADVTNTPLELALMLGRKDFPVQPSTAPLIYFYDGIPEYLGRDQKTQGKIESAEKAIACSRERRASPEHIADMLYSLMPDETLEFWQRRKLLKDLILYLALTDKRELARQTIEFINSSGSAEVSFDSTATEGGVAVSYEYSSPEARPRGELVQLEIFHKMNFSNWL